MGPYCNLAYRIINNTNFVTVPSSSPPQFALVTQLIRTRYPAPAAVNVRSICLYLHNPKLNHLTIPSSSSPDALPCLGVGFAFKVIRHGWLTDFKAGQKRRAQRSGMQEEREYILWIRSKNALEYCILIIILLHYNESSDDHLPAERWRSTAAGRQQEEQDAHKDENARVHWGWFASKKGEAREKL